MDFFDDLSLWFVLYCGMVPFRVGVMRAPGSQGTHDAEILASSTITMLELMLLYVGL